VHSKLEIYLIFKTKLEKRKFVDLGLRGLGANTATAILGAEQRDHGV
jgi:hypothetical protein